MDVLIITALQEEYEAARRAGSTGFGNNPGVSSWASYDADSSAPYIAGQFILASGEPLSVALARPTRMGGIATAPITAELVTRLKPRCLAMCGVCAGNPAEVTLGDVIVAEIAYQYDEGKRTQDAVKADHRQIPLSDAWVRAAQDMSVTDLPGYGPLSDEAAKLWIMECLLAGRDPRTSPGRSRYVPDDVWSAHVSDLNETRLVRGSGPNLSLTGAGRSHIRRIAYHDVASPARLPFAVVVGPMASANTVVADGRTWDQLVQWGVRTVAGLDLEAAMIANVAHRMEVPEWVVAKGVMDHANPQKGDRYKPFAARVSAEVLYKLLSNRLAGNDRPRLAVTGVAGAPETRSSAEDITDTWDTEDDAGTPVGSSGIDAFVSYRHRDFAEVEPIARRLRDRGLSLFLDRWNLVPGEPYQPALERAINNCRTAIVFIGADGTGGWHERETHAMLARQSGDASFRVIPVLLPRAAKPAGFIAANTWVDFGDMDDQTAFDYLVAGVEGRAPKAVTTLEIIDIAERFPMVTRAAFVGIEFQYASFLAGVAHSYPKLTRQLFGVRIRLLDNLRQLKVSPETVALLRTQLDAESLDGMHGTRLAIRENLAFSGGAWIAEGFEAGFALSSLAGLLDLYQVGGEQPDAENTRLVLEYLDSLASHTVRSAPGLFPGLVENDLPRWREMVSVHFGLAEVESLLAAVQERILQFSRPYGITEFRSPDEFLDET